MFWNFPWLYLGQVTGLISITVFSLSFIFATRLSLLWAIFGELEYTYKIHKVAGITGSVFLLLHILFLFIHSLSKSFLFNYYWIPGSGWPMEFGRISLALFVIVVLTTYIKKIPYHIWKFIHYLSGPAFFFAVLHVITVSRDIKSNAPLRYWIFGMMGAAILSYIYIRFLYRYIGPKHKYVVSDVEMIGENYCLVSMKPKGKSMRYNPAQFAFFSFQSSELGREVHPYTITSSVDSDLLQIMCKTEGDWARKMSSLQCGTVVDVWGPYGIFWDDYQMSRQEQIWIAGGIGVTPFISMLEYERTRPIRTKKWFVYSTMSEEDDVSDRFLSDHLQDTNVTLINHYANRSGYLNVEFIEKNISNLKDKVFFMCGSTPMVRELTRGLIEVGVPPNNIVHEDFSFR